MTLVAPAGTCPHGAEDHVLLSGTSLRARLVAGDPIREGITRADVAAILHRADADRRVAP